jgi:hypothetical protein
LQSRSGTRRLLSRLTSLRGVSTRSGTYNRINDEESDLGKRPLGGVEEGDESTEHLQSDANAVQMNEFNSQKKVRSTVDAMEEQRDVSEAGYAAEYERLEAQLGAGMSSITEKPFTHNPAPIGPGSYSRQPRGLPNTESTVSQAQNAQEEAEKLGGIVAVAEIPVDISESFGGGDFETRSMMTGSTRPDKDEAQKSYFFPKGSLVPSVNARQYTDSIQILTCHHGVPLQWVGRGWQCWCSLHLHWLLFKSSCVDCL